MTQPALSTPSTKAVSALGIFIAWGLWMWVVTQVIIPWLSDFTGLESAIFWFTLGGLGIFLPFLLLSYIILRKEGIPAGFIAFKERLRFHPMTKDDWCWGLGAMIVVGILSTVFLFILGIMLEEVKHQPSFMAFEPLTVGRYWILALWLPYWILNMMGEEVLWRGVLLPRMESGVGKNAWVVQAVGWGLFHVSFGWQILITLLPILFILPWVVQKRRNTWIGVLIHAGLNGPSFLAIAFGQI
ncbi:CPBP family intramembrane glutamic endopeptidase [Candidatus Neomarinimicrobiota bacterium]